MNEVQNGCTHSRIRIVVFDPLLLSTGETMAEKRKELMSNYDYIRQVTKHYIPGLFNPGNLNIKHEIFNHELLNKVINLRRDTFGNSILVKKL